MKRCLGMALAAAVALVAAGPSSAAPGDVRVTIEARPLESLLLAPDATEAPPKTESADDTPFLSVAASGLQVAGVLWDDE